MQDRKCAHKNPNDKNSERQGAQNDEELRRAKTAVFRKSRYPIVGQGTRSSRNIHTIRDDKVGEG